MSKKSTTAAPSPATPAQLKKAARAAAAEAEQKKTTAAERAAAKAAAKAEADKAKAKAKADKAAAVAKTKAEAKAARDAAKKKKTPPVDPPAESPLAESASASFETPASADAGEPPAQPSPATGNGREEGDGVGSSRPPPVEPSAPGKQDDWPVMDAAAYHGLPGRFVRTIAPHTEADPAGLLMHLLAFYGNIIGRLAHMILGGTKHFAILDVIIVGLTALARKGTAADETLNIFQQAADQVWLDQITPSLATTAGLIKLVKDKEPEDETEPDKRRLFLIREMSSLFVAMRRGDLGAKLNDAWDGKNLENPTKQKPMKSTNPMISIVGHITDTNLVAAMTNLLASSGWGNRYLYIRVRRSGRLPNPTAPDAAVIADLIAALKDAIDFGTKAKLVEMTEAAKQYWDKHLYDDVNTIAPGALGEMMSRQAPNLRRLAMIYTLLDKAEKTDVVHLQAAYAIVKYSRTSVEQIFAEKLADPKIEKILTALTKAGKETGMKRSDIYDNIFKGRVPAFELTALFDYLVTQGKIHRKIEKLPGKKSTEWLYIV